MEALIDAIWESYNRDNTLKDALSGGLYFAEAPGSRPKTKMPYGAFNIITNTPLWTMGSETSTRREEYLIQFSFWSEDNSRSEIMDIQAAAISCFDWSTDVEVSGYTVTWIERNTSQLIREPPDQVWHLIIEYHIRIQAT